MAAPTIPSWEPTGSKPPDVSVYFRCSDDVQVIEASLDLGLTAPGAVFATPVLVNGVWQGGYNGTIVANGSNGFDVTLTTHPPFEIGIWAADAYCEDGGALSASKNWNFTIIADDPTLDVYEPSGFTTSMDRIYCKVSDDWGFDTTTLTFEAIPPVGPTLTGISGGVVQAGWTGSIIGIDDPGTGPREILINLTAWPDLATPQLWTFRATCETIVGTEL